jgi:hypothetical protein
MNTSSMRGLPKTPVNVTDTWAVPPDCALITGKVVSITGVGAQPPPATTTPAGITVLPSTTATRTNPRPEMKKRIEGWVAPTQA